MNRHLPRLTAVTLAVLLGVCNGARAAQQSHERTQQVRAANHDHAEPLSNDLIDYNQKPGEASDAAFQQSAHQLSG